MNKVKSKLRWTWRKLLKPQEYQILLPSIWVWVLVEMILNKWGVNIRDIPSEFVSESVIYAWFITTILSAFKYSTGKIEDISSKVKADNIILWLSQNWDILRGTCNMLYQNGIDTDSIKDPSKTLKAQRELKYTYLAMVLLSSYLVRWETGPCFNCFTAVCNNWWDGTAHCFEDTEQNRHYKKIFKQAIKHIVEVEGYSEPITSDSVSLIVEVINTLEDSYDKQFVSFARETWSPFTTTEEAIAISQLTIKPEVETLNFLKEQARNRRAFFYLLCSLSAASMGKTEWVEALQWMNDYFIKDILDFLASHANAIVGTTIAYISARALWTMNNNNIITKYTSKRLTPDTRRMELESKEKT